MLLNPAITIQARDIGGIEPREHLTFDEVKPYGNFSIARTRNLLPDPSSPENHPANRSKNRRNTSSQMVRIRF